MYSEMFLDLFNMRIVNAVQPRVNALSKSRLRVSPLLATTKLSFLPRPRELSTMNRTGPTISVEVKMTPEQYRKRKVALISGTLSRDDPVLPSDPFVRYYWARWILFV